MEIPFINIHTHQNNSQGIVISYSETESLLPTEGIHPWRVEEHPEEQLLLLEQQLISNSIVAIGESGLDRVHKETFQQQQVWFEKQLQLAKKYNKPVIIHCVKAYADMIPFFKQNPSLSFILHGYNGNSITTKQLMKYSVYFSFGKSFMQDHAKTMESFLYLPTDRIFLENDESDFSIASIYEKAAQTKQMDLIQLKERIFANYNQLFGTWNG
ncbi:hypothetical protein EMN47_19855 [Prolixibacteraceae bacterium JC049]|nr:hypothetical protein [Prolixibacteraceae bacterium JC049]